MAGNSKIEVIAKQPAGSSEDQKRFFSTLGGKISDSFKLMGQRIKEHNSSARENNPYIQAQTYAEKREKAQNFMESLFQRIPGFLAIAGVAIGAYISGISLSYIIIGVIIFLLIIFSCSGKLVLQISIFIIIVAVLVFGGTTLWPLAQAYARANQEKNPAVSALSSVTEFTKTMRANLQLYIDTQIACASGDCPQGEAEGEYVGISLSTPALMRPDKEYSVGDPLTVSTDVEGVNLRVYSNINAETNCSIVKDNPVSITPKKIPFSDISNSKRTISCVLKAVKTNSNVNTIKTSISFPFNTTSDLKVYVMDYTRRNLMLEMWGQDFLSTHYNLDQNPAAKFNDGPINLGIRVNQIPIGVRSSAGSEDDGPAELTFALYNQWGYYGGEVLSVDDIEINLPSNMAIYAITSEDDDACPFEKSSDGYHLKKKDDANYTIKTVRTFVCGLKVSKPETQSFDIWTGHIRITAKYKYRLTSRLNINLKTGEATASAGEDPYTGTDGSSGTFDFGDSCSSISTSYSTTNEVKAYESSSYGNELQTALSSVSNIDGMSALDTKALMLGIISAESNVGIGSTKDSSGNPHHMAGCLAATDYDVTSEINCERNSLNALYNSDTCTSLSDTMKGYGFDRLDCTIFCYNRGCNGENDAKQIEYRSTVKSRATNLWKPFLCAKYSGIVV